MQNSHIEAEIPTPKNIRDAKNLGGIGAILFLLSPIPYIGWVLSIVGLVLVLVAIKKIADMTDRREIFQDYIKAFILGVISIVAFFVLLWGSILSMLGSLSGFGSAEAALGTGFGGIILAVIASLALSITAAYFQRRSFRKITEETGEKLFATTGNTYFIGSILVVILVGFLIQFIAAIMEIAAFFSLPDEL
jgi:uncharacterized membrane protein